MPVPPIFGCTNIFQARILGEHKLNNAWFDAADKKALITGGGGIGVYMATALSDASADVTLVGWRLDMLEAMLA
jgi:pyruvate/2-oxoglutarate dehydrogenase complex dihydrolipoamide dehydrogenase (E3) component